MKDLRYEVTKDGYVNYSGFSKAQALKIFKENKKDADQSVFFINDYAEKIWHKGD